MTQVVKNIKVTFNLFIFIFGLLWSPTSKASPNKILPQNVCDQVINHQFYKVCYAKEFRQAIWTFHKLNEQLIRGPHKRTNDYRRDELVLNPVNKGDYSQSGFDRGHLVPAADMKLNRESMSESFYMSNMSPQKPEFNRGIWQSIEKAVRRAITLHGEALIITGPILYSGLPQLKKKISIPEQFYKIIYWPNQKKAIAFLIENKGFSGKKYYHFQVSIDEVEDQSGLDFFSGLEDREEEILESEIVAIDF